MLGFYQKSQNDSVFSSIQWINIVDGCEVDLRVYYENTRDTVIN